MVVYSVAYRVMLWNKRSISLTFLHVDTFASDRATESPGAVYYIENCRLAHPITGLLLNLVVMVV